MKYSVLLLFLLVIFSQNNNAQKTSNPILEREITIHCQNQNIESILAEISTQAGFIFSYSPDAINRDKKITLQVNHKPVRLVLNQLFDDAIDYKVKNKYLILHKKSSRKNNPKESIKLEGYVYDSRTGKKLTETSIYNKTLMASAVTDKYGYFTLKLPPNKPLTSLRVSKMGYSDTTFSTNILEHHFTTIEIASAQKDTMQNKNLMSYLHFPKITPKWLIPKKVKINSLNISDSILSKVQLSLLPMVTTNQLMGGNAVNKVSFNLTVGYVQGVKYAEFGGIMNIDLGDVSYYQSAGIGNIVGQNVTGFQSAGIFNYANSVKGVQSSGIINISIHNADFQFSGIANISSESELQAAGILNVAQYAKLQVAGVLNIADSVKEIQGSGVINISAQKAKLQISGVANITNESKVQVAGCINYSKKDAVIQIAGLINKARYVKKTQIALINIADSCDGIPFGLLSFIKNGYHKIELSADEILTTTIAFRTGVKQFHTFVSTGISTGNTKIPMCGFGFGIGTSFWGTPKSIFDLDISSVQLLDRTNFNFSHNLYKAYFGFDRKLSGKLSLAAGITYNLLITDTQNSKYKYEYSETAPYSFTNSTFGNGINLKTWIGGKIALRIL